jgi:hypothetical protein
MSALKAHVVNGRILSDEPVDLPEGTAVVVHLSEHDNLDDMDEAERSALFQALDEADADYEAGHVVSEEEVWAAVRAIK